MQNLVNITNFSIERKLIPITLQMGGLLVSGLMIAGDIYFKDDGSVVRQLITQCGDIYREGRKNPANMSSNIVYIHLKDCTVVSNHTKSKYTTLWRGLLSKVDGFFLGTFSPVSKLPSNDEVEKTETFK